MKNKIIKTVDKHEWLVINEVTFENVHYLLVVGIDSHDQRPNEDMRVAKKIEKDGKTYIEMEKSTDILKRVCPLLEKGL